MADRFPYAMPSPVIEMAKALVALGEVEEWWNLPTQDAVSVMIKATGGSINPTIAADQFREAVESVGLEPIEERIDGNR